MGGSLHFNPIHIVRGLQGFLALLAMGLLAHVAQFFNSHSSVPSTSNDAPAINVPSQVVFGIFVSVMTILVTLPYVLLTPRFFPHLFKSHTKHTILALEFISMIFWFAAFVAVAAFLGRLDVCRGDVCHAAKAGAGVAAISWLSWGVTSIFALRFCLGMVGVDIEQRQQRPAENLSIVSEIGMTEDDDGFGKVERKRERFVKGVRVHAAWIKGLGRSGGDRDDDVVVERETTGGAHGWPTQQRWDTHSAGKDRF